MTPFKSDTDYFDPSRQLFMINLHVDDVLGMLAKAKADGTEIIDEVTDEGYGVFWLVFSPGRRQDRVMAGKILILE